MKGNDGVIRRAKLRDVNRIRESLLQLLFFCETVCFKTRWEESDEMVERWSWRVLTEKERAAKTNARERLKQTARAVQDEDL